MSILCKPYEISLWVDEWNGEKYVEKRMMVLGSDKMEAQCRALEPKLTRKTNGEISFSFKMYYQYIDNITGEKTRNPFVDYIANESKIKLEYNNEWFDLLVKNISKDSSTSTYLYTLQDQNVNELSKNGFNLTLDSSLMNNMGTIDQLGQTILADTDWTIDSNSEKIVQTEDESLVPCKVTASFTATMVNDSDLGKNGAIAGNIVTIPKDSIIYVFYSSCSGSDPYRFQFMYKEGGFSSSDKNSDRIITTKGCQYYRDGLSYVKSGIFTLPSFLSLTYPEGNTSVSLLYRGRRYVYSQESDYHAGLDRYLQKYTNGSKDYYAYTVTNYVTPNLIQNFVTNDQFSGDAGWKGSKFCPEKPEKPEGASKAKKLNTYLRSYTWEQWWPFIQTGSEQQWVINEGHNNSHIAKDDIIKIEGVISNQNSTPITVYAKVTSIDYIDKTDPNVNNYRHVDASTVWYSVGTNELDMEIEASSFRVTSDNKYLVEGLTDHLQGNFSEKNTYYPCLRCGRLNGNSSSLRKVLVNSGPYDMRNNFEGFSAGDKYVVEMEFYYVTKTEDGNYAISDFANSASVLGRAQVKVRLSNFELDTNRGGYVWDQFNHNTTFELTGSDKDKDKNGFVDHTLWYSRAVLGRVPEDSRDSGAEVLRLENGLYSYRQVVSTLGNLSREDFLEDKYRLFIEFPDINNAKDASNFIFIKKLAAYKHHPKANEVGYYTPEDTIEVSDITYQEETKYFPVQENDTRTKDTIPFLHYTSVAGGLKPILSPYGAKRSSINIKESNYFNAIQTLAETFECWPQIVVTHDEDGTVTNKSICFKNYIGQPNYSGFKYGVNEKGIKRTLDSKQLVSKLIVKANTNEFGKNGFCSVARASSNELKDNVLYDFSHYINTGLLTDVEGLQNHLYGYKDDLAELTELDKLLNATSKLTQVQIDSITAKGYYPKLRLINLQLESLATLITDKSVPLAQATADYNVAKAGYDAAQEEFIKIADKFYNVAGFSYNVIQQPNTEEDKTRLEQVQKSTTLLGYLTQLTELATQKKTYKAQYETANTEKEALQNAYDALNLKYNNAVNLKNSLNKKFYFIYYRFIQEGTWIDQSYMDDNLYFNDAKVVLYNSTKPKVSYTLNVISLAGIPGYENIDFKIGDQTFIEDTEYFGYDLDGNPFREQVTITETIENLEDPSKNTIKVQNYENQFQDLFKKITATVQSVKYTEGSYQKAAALAEADTAHKISYLTDALTDAATVLTNAGNQTWTLDEKGLTIDDPARGEGLRAIGGAILLKQKDEKGDDKWVTGMTSKGVSADLITAGQINTGEIQIMNANQPTFRWDSHGLTAYDFDNSTNDIRLSGWNPTKGVRFDRFGLYGYTGIDGETWHPTTISGDSTVGTIEDFSTFYLTWEGLKVTHKDKNTGSTTVIKLGNNAQSDEKNNILFRATKIVDGESEDMFSFDNNGNLELKGNIKFGSTINGQDIGELAFKDEIGDFVNDFTAELQESIDQKAEVWYQDSDPSTNWTTTEMKQAHIGDLWKCTKELAETEDSPARDKNSEWIYHNSLTYNNKKYTFEVLVYKSTLAQQSSWNSTRLYSIVDSNKGCVYYYYKDGWTEAKVSQNNKFVYEWSAIAGILIEEGFITDNTLCYIEYTKRLWKGKTSQWEANDATKVLFKYLWEEMEVPETVFNKINGKSTIYTTWPDSPQAGDLLIPTTNITKDSKSYKAGKVYRYTDSGWEEVTYANSGEKVSFEHALDTAIDLQTCISYIDKSFVGSFIVDSDDKANASIGNIVEIPIQVKISESEQGLVRFCFNYVKDEGDNRISVTGTGIWYTADTDPKTSLKPIIERQLLMKQITTTEEDGIYNDYGKIGIRATAINTGALNIGGDPNNNYRDAKFYADITGGAAYISGWTLKNDCLVKYGQNEDGSYKDALTKDEELKNDQAFIQPGGTRARYTIGGKTTSGWAIGIGPNFGVTTDGTIYAKNATFSDGAISGGTIKIGGTSTNPNFAVDSNGNVTLKGNITWGSNGPSDGDTIYTTYLYYRSNSSSAPSKPTSTTTSGWTTSPQGVTSSYKYEYVSACTVTNGNYGTWSTPVLWARYGTDGSSATVNRDNIVSAIALSNMKTGDGIYSNNGIIAINASAIKTGYIGFGSTYYIDPFNAKGSNQYIYLPGLTVTKSGTTISGTLSVGTPYSSIELGAGVFKCSSNDSSWQAGIEFDEQTSSRYGSFVIAGATLRNCSSSSDIRVKQNIQNLNERFDIFFEYLHPVSYSYKQDNSHGIHTGFIAQEVQQAMQMANLTDKDLAIVETAGTNGELDIPILSLHYFDFIALNTSQIQKLKARISVLEERIAKLSS